MTISPYVSSNPYLQCVVTDYSVKTLGRLAAGLAVGLMLGTSVFFLGQAANYSLQAQALDKKLAALGAQDQTGAQAARAQIQGLNTLKRDLDQADPMSALQAAQTLLTPFGYKLSRFAVDSQRVSFDLPTEASAGVDLLTEELEASPYFSQVEPVLAPRTPPDLRTRPSNPAPSSPISLRLPWHPRPRRRPWALRPVRCPCFLRTAYPPSAPRSQFAALLAGACAAARCRCT